MACTSIVALPRACGTEGIQGGLDKLYIIAFTDTKPHEDAVNVGDVWTAASNGVINGIAIDTGKRYVEVGLLQNSAGLTEAVTKNLQNGTAFYTQTITLPLSEITTENRTFVKSILNQPVSFIVKAASGKHYVAGLNGKLELSALEGGLGVAPGDQNGYTLTFTGIDKDLIPLVDNTTVEASLIAAS